MKRLAWAGVIVAVLAGVAALGSPIMRPRCAQVAGSVDVAIPLSRLERGASEFFCYRDSAGERLRFILARDVNGRVNAVFDACRQCYKFHKGYTVSGGYLICRLCGNRYKIQDMQAGKASCVPVSLPIAQSNGKVEIKVADLQKAQGLF